MPESDDRYSDEPESRPPERRREERPDEDYEDDRRRRYDDLDVSRRGRADLSWIDKQFLDTNMAVLVVAALCCGIFTFTFGLVGVFTCTHPDAKQKALVMTIISGIIVGLSVAMRFASVAGKM